MKNTWRRLSAFHLCRWLERSAGGWYRCVGAGIGRALWRDGRRTALDCADCQPPQRPHDATAPLRTTERNDATQFRTTSAMRDHPGGRDAATVAGATGLARSATGHAVSCTLSTESTPIQCGGQLRLSRGSASRSRLVASLSWWAKKRK